MKKQRVVEIEWLDSWSWHGWEDRKKKTSGDGDEAGICRSVGYFLGRDKQFTRVTESLSKNDNAGCVISIPNSSVKRMRTLR